MVRAIQKTVLFKKNNKTHNPLQTNFTAAGQNAIIRYKNSSTVCTKSMAAERAQVNFTEYTTKYLCTHGLEKTTPM